MRYVLTIIGEEATGPPPPPEEMQAMIEPWTDYTRELTEAGAFLAGEGLQPSVAATTIKHAPGGERLVTDGPFAETKEQLGGFYLIDVANLDEALEWAKKVPVAEGGAVEVRPAMVFDDAEAPSEVSVAS